MIYTVTVNPALDVTLLCNAPVAPGTARPREEWRHAGGKGIDVSRAIRNLGGPSVAMGLLGGFTGHVIEGLLLEDALEIDFVRISQETRTNVIIITPDPADAAQKVTYRYNAPGPGFQPIEYLELYGKIRDLAAAPLDQRPTYAAICGSLSGTEMNASSYVSIIREFKRMGAVTALDTSGAAMKEALRYAPRPDIVKPNIAEFNELMGDGLLSPAEKTGELSPSEKEEILRRGCQSTCGGEGDERSEFWKRLLSQAIAFRAKYPDLSATLITLGGAGMLLVQQGCIHHAWLNRPVEVVSPVGAGDAALGAFIFARDQNKGWDESLKLAVAAGGAAVTMPGTEAPSAEVVNGLTQNVEMHEEPV
jgi:fructose-1-phosphate kinase PfkB-like protein